MRLLEIRIHLKSALVAICVVATWTHKAHAQAADVTAQFKIVSRNPHGTHRDASGVVLWLSPLQPIVPAPRTSPVREYTLAQKNKQFTPHVIVVPLGSSVNFPNLDPFFHNVFSLFNGKRFDLGLYEGHTTRTVRFDREGVSYIFCNIHPKMGAVVISLATPFYAISTQDGEVNLHDIPPGQYRLNVWAENVSIDLLSAMSRVIEVSGKRVQLGSMSLEASGDVMGQHENKFGESYTTQPNSPY